MGHAQILKAYLVLPKQDIAGLSVDHQGRIYTSDYVGNITSYDTGWHIDQTYAPRVQSRFKNIDVSALKIYGFSESQQELTILNRFLTQPLIYDLEILTDGFVSDLCRGVNNTIWVLEQNAYEVKNIDFLTKEVHASIFLNKLTTAKNIEVLSMSFANGVLFIHLADMGVLLLDNQGNLIKKLVVEGRPKIGFNGDDIFYIDKKQLVVHRLDDESVDRWQLDKDFNQQLQVIIRTSQFVYMLADEGVYRLRLPL